MKLKWDYFHSCILEYLNLTWLEVFIINSQLSFLAVAQSVQCVMEGQGWSFSYDKMRWNLIVKPSSLQGVCPRLELKFMDTVLTISIILSTSLLSPRVLLIVNRFQFCLINFIFREVLAPYSFFFFFFALQMYF